MPSNAVAHICLLVKDLDQATADWTKLLKVLYREQLAEPVVLYGEFEAGADSMRWAIFVSHDGPEIQLMGPGADTPLGQRRPVTARWSVTSASRHQTCRHDGAPQARGSRVQDHQSVQRLDDAVAGVEWIPPRAAPGTLVEVARPYRAVNRKWESAAD
jgi:methylmalonyl-CoA/ethylmalonyl-CoA epimerase